MKFQDATKAARKILKLKYCGAVIVAAGNASRMGGIDKVMAPFMSFCFNPTFILCVNDVVSCG